MTYRRLSPLFPRREGFPPHWIESAIPYGQLKKCIKKVEGELRSFGLDAETLGHLGPDHETQDSRSHSGDTPVAFKYQFTGKTVSSESDIECRLTTKTR